MVGSLLFLTVIFFITFLARIILSPLMPVVEADLHLDHGQAGALFLPVAFGYFLALMASGYVSSRIKHHHTIVLSAVTIGLALIGTSFSRNLWGIHLGMFAVGIAAGLYFPSGMATITSLFQVQHWGKAIGVHELAPNLAFLVAPLFCEMLLAYLSWHSILALTGLVSLLLGAAFGYFGRSGDFPGEAPAFRPLRALFREPVFWIMLVLFSLGISSTVGIYSMLPLFLVSERGMEISSANTIVALSRLPSLGMALLSGWAADRVGAKKTMTAVLLATGILTLLLGLAPGTWTIVIVFLQAMVAVSFFPAAFAALSSIGMASSRNIVIAFTIPFAFLIGGGAVPTAIGMFGKEGAFGWGISMVGLLMLTGVMVTGLIKMPDSDRN